MGTVRGKQTCPLLQYHLRAAKSSPHHVEPLRFGAGSGEDVLPLKQFDSSFFFQELSLWWLQHCWGA